jgi:transposase InsO family protein
MPWQETGVELERMKFIVEWYSGEWTMSELCRQFGVSRPTGYALVQRFQTDGLDGLKDRSSAPRRHPNAVPDERARRILKVRGDHPSWGPVKIKAWLEKRFAHETWPAASTIGELLKREGLVAPRKRQRPRYSFGEPLTPASDCNRVWCADFKGWFRTGDGQRCDPFTLMDACSRYLLRCQALGRLDGASVQPVLEAAFGEFGLPQVLRTDNGPPFGGPGLGGLSKLAVWLIKVGVRPERIEPGKPQQNGRLERLHRTLKAETASPPAANRNDQQARFRAFRAEYNEQRPHGALAERTPASVYVASPRDYRRPAQPLSYSRELEVRRVTRQGDIHWRNGVLPVGSALAGETVGLRQIDDDARYWQMYVGPVPLAMLDDQYGVWLSRREAAEVNKHLPPKTVSAVDWPVDETVKDVPG